MSIAYIGIGSNLGNRKENIDKSLEFIRESAHTDILKVSSFIETEPEFNVDMPYFLNGVVKIDTSLSPGELLSFLKDIEIKLGRKNKGNNEPRYIDLDILLYGIQEIDSQDLVIPHPRMFRRKFVLGPLLEVEPDIIKENPLICSHKEDIIKIIA